jgi:hypothetical protein
MQLVSALALGLAGSGCAIGPGSAARQTPGAAMAEAAAPTQAPPNVELDTTELLALAQPVSREQALADLDHALYLFREAYAGELALEPADVARSRQRIAARATWSPAELAAELAGLFDVRDEHLAFDYGGPLPLRGLSAAQQALADLGPWLPEGPGAEPSHDGLTWIAAGASARPVGPPVELTPGPVPVLAIRTFDNRAETWLRDLPGLARRLTRAPGFVVDLRGNGGGNFAFAEAFLLELTDDDLTLLDESEVMSRTALEGRVNTARYDVARGAVSGDTRQHYERHIGVLEQRLAEARHRAATRVEIERKDQRVRGRASRAYEGRVVLLVDGGCASACEMMIALARQLPNAIVAGTSTRGAMEVGEIATFRLPRSGVVVRFGTRRYRDPSGDFTEARGYAPDVRLSGEDALIEAMRLALDPR